MSKQNPSIEDLMGGSGSTPGAKPGKAQTDLTPQEKLSQRMSKINEEQLEKAAERKAASAGVGYVNLKGFPVSPEALRLLPFKRAKELKMIPFLLLGEELRIGAVDPTNEGVKEAAFQIGEREKAHPDIYLISERSFEQGLKLYDTLPKIRAVTEGVEISEEEIKTYRKSIKTIADLQPLLAGATTTDIVAILLAAALEIGTSDIHIEAEEKQVAVRYRIDGVLQAIATIPKESWKQLVNRIKLVAGLKLNITTAPQDGRFTIHFGGENIDVRTSALPTAFGESVVMRLLVPSAISLKFEELGFRKPAFEKLQREIVKPNGMIVTTGPTGSGKTTTLYAILNKLNTEDVKIITLEDPIEYKLQGINQSQIDHSKEYTFSKGLRSILRQDPDIVMVGEIRDKETADTAVQAALTGHLLLSTIHTNDAAGAVPRFLSMGVESALLAPALRIIMGQRLLRRLCSKCKQPTQLDPEMLERVTKVVGAIPANSGETPDIAAATWFKGVGCAECGKDGYKGRVGIYEILVIDTTVEERIRAGSVTDKDMLAIGQAQGMTTMEQDGILKAMDGDTTVEEVFRVAAT